MKDMMTERNMAGLSLIAFVLFLIAMTIGHAAKAADVQTECPWFVPLGKPLDVLSRQNVELCRAGYANHFDLEGRVPLWTAYLLDETRTVGCESRAKFMADRDVPVPFRVRPADYNSTGFDRGHIVNAADQAYDHQAESDSFLMSNMSPQYPGFNRGVFKNLEDQVRRWALADHRSLLVYVGNTWTDDGKRMNGVAVPDHVWKIIVDLKSGEVMSFYMPNEEGHQDFSPFVTSVETIQNNSGLLIPLPKGASEKIVYPIWKITSIDRATIKAAACGAK